MIKSKRKRPRTKIQFKESHLNQNPISSKDCTFFTKRKAFLSKSSSMPQLKVSDLEWLNLFSKNIQSNIPIKRTLIDDKKVQENVSQHISEKTKMVDSIVQTHSENKTKSKIAIPKLQSRSTPSN